MGLKSGFKKCGYLVLYGSLDGMWNLSDYAYQAVNKVVNNFHTGGLDDVLSNTGSFQGPLIEIVGHAAYAIPFVFIVGTVGYLAHRRKKK